jgi:hypothetical protein
MNRREMRLLTDMLVDPGVFLKETQETAQQERRTDTRIPR